MSAIGGMLGLNGGLGGTGFNTTAGTNPGQLAAAYQGTQGALGSQQALLNAIQAQNGLGNQSQVYNQLQGVVSGTGPNPAAAMLANSTGANVANQAALMAGQRGAGANVGLMARQAAQQGAGIQQNAVGQAAQMQAQQSLNALGQAGQMANTQAGNQIAATGANTQAQMNEQQMLQGANAQNNNIQGQLANTRLQGGQQLISSAIGGAMSAAGGGMGAYDGGVIGYADGGGVGAAGGISGPQSMLGQDMAKFSAAPQTDDQLANGVSSLIGAAKSQLNKPSTPMTDANFTKPELGSQFAGTAPSLGVAGQPAAGPSLGVNTTLPGTAPANIFGVNTQMARGGDVGSKLKSGGKVPGTAVVAGNSPKNDTVKAALSPGEGVIDRETMGHPGPIGDAARFVMAYVNKKKMAQ